MQTSRYIPKKYLKQAQKDLSLSYEICGLIRPVSKKRDDVLGLKVTNEGEYIKHGNRGSCVSTNVWMNYHTHPYRVLPWPSTEDVFKILYDRGHDPVLWGCLIFTEWGVWEIYCPKKENVEDIDKDYTSITQETSDRLYNDIDLFNRDTIPSLDEVKSQVTDYIKLWKKKYKSYNLEITLTAWEAIPSNYAFKTNLKQVPPY